MCKNQRPRVWDMPLLLVSLVLVVILMVACKRATTPSSIPTSETQNSPQTAQVPQAPQTTEITQPFQPTDTLPARENLPAGDSSHSLQFGDLQRTYILHIPTGYTASRPTPLVLAFHGIGLDANEMIRISGLNAKSDSSGFIIAYPDGTGAKKSWNGGHCCGEAAVKKVDDVGFVRALTSELSSLANIDPKRIYATGFSNGAIFTYRLACEMADQIAAVAPVSATQVDQDQNACRPVRPIPLLHFHGTNDQLNPYEGGTTSVGTTFLSVEDAIRFWVSQEDCPSNPQQTKSGSIIHDLYTPCRGNSTVELYTIQGGEHAWPGGEAVSAQVGEPTTEISANDLMWDFFTAHPLP